MTPKEKTQDLIVKYRSTCYNKQLVKKAALICVDEIIAEKERVLADMNKLFDENVKPINGYWNEVKTEIQKL